MSEKQLPPNNSDNESYIPINTHRNEDFAEVAKKLEVLIDKLDRQKKRDFWDRFQILASFISSVLFAGVGLYFTTVYNNREAKRHEDLQSAQLARAEREEERQIEMQSIQKEITQLEAIISLTPLLASKDKETKRYAMMTLQAFDSSKSFLHTTFKDNDSNKIRKGVSKAENTSGRTINSYSTLLNKFAQIALAENSTIKDRNEAVKSLRNIAVDPKTSKIVKEEATGYVKKIADSKKVPKETRQVANDYLKEIMDIPILDNDQPVQVEVVFGYANIGSSLISIYDSSNKLIAQFKGDQRFTLPKLDFNNTKYFNVVIFGTSIDINPSTDKGVVNVSSGCY